MFNFMYLSVIRCKYTRFAAISQEKGHISARNTIKRTAKHHQTDDKVPLNGRQSAIK